MENNSKEILKQEGHLPEEYILNRQYVEKFNARHEICPDLEEKNETPVNNFMILQTSYCNSKGNETDDIHLSIFKTKNILTTKQDAIDAILKELKASGIQDLIDSGWANLVVSNDNIWNHLEFRIQYENSLDDIFTIISL